MEYLNSIEKLFLEIIAEFEIKSNFYYFFDEGKFQMNDDQ